MTLKACAVCGRPTPKARCPEHQLTRNGSTRQWRTLRQAILSRDGHRCQHCGAPATHVDHIHPLAKGGTDDPAQLQALCATCNLTKGDRIP